jgi:hypothetical protein
MRISTITKPSAAVLTVVLLAGLFIRSTQPAQAADLLLKGAPSFAPSGELGVIASGAAEDTLKACLDRIPEVASAGQRMLAEQTCAGEEETRQVIRSAPNF